MFHVGSFRSQSCQGLSRRSFLSAASTMACAYGLRTPTLAQESISPRAKSVVLVWLWGAPSHLDTFDPKPDAPLEYRGPFSPIATRTPGVRITDLLPQLAQRSDKYTLIRSHVSSQPGHPDAGTVSLTGFHERPEPIKPNFGSIVARHRGQKGQLPPFISVGRGIPRDASRSIEGYGGGTLGKSYDPLQLHVAESGQVDVPDLQLLDGISPNRITDRQSLLTRLDEDRRRIDGLGVEQWNRTYQRALGLLSHPKSREAFDLTRETDATRDRFGFSTFGQSCLLTRRLLEAEVPYIQLNWSQTVEAITPNYDFGWDTHIYNFELMQDRHCPILDRTLSAFIDDLSDRGLLETTLVVVMGEFGRTPRINERSARDHWPRCYFSLWMGAGIPGGQVIGESNKLGEDPLTNPITPLMVGTTIAEFAGINTQARAELNVLNGGQVIDELF
ncbi:MAG: DUF1501 domain-containing protein [Planctomycetaceae bacterium]